LEASRRAKTYPSSRWSTLLALIPGLNQKLADWLAKSRKHLRS
jgi:hypothetical protein